MGEGRGEGPICQPINDNSADRASRMPRCCSRFVGYERDYPQSGYGQRTGDGTLRRAWVAQEAAFMGAGFASWLEPGNGPDIATRDTPRGTLKRSGRAAAGF